MAYKFYAVKAGRTPGIYTTWLDCKAQVDGFTNPVYKGFDNGEDAIAFLEGRLDVKTARSKNAEDIAAARSKRKIPPSKVDNVSRGEAGFDENNPPSAYAFVDGSYDADSGVYGYGGFLVENGNEHIIQGSGKDGKSWNIDGEVRGCMAAIDMAISLGLTELVIFHDLDNTAKWATGEYKAKVEISQEYVGFILSAAKKITLRFEKVKGHSDLPGNDRADALAREAVAKHI